MVVITNVALDIEKIDPAVKLIPLKEEASYPEAKDAAMFVGFPGDITEDFLNAHPKLQLVQVLPAGFDALAVSLEELQKRNIKFAYGHSVCHKAISESVVMMLLMAAKRFKEAVINQQAHKWVTLADDIIEVAGKTVLVMGCGSNGTQVARRLGLGLEMHVLGYDAFEGEREYFEKVYAGREGLLEALGKADYVVNCLPLTPQTNKIINKETLAAMKNTATFINIGRGGSVDQPALIEALQNGVIHFACLDVFDQEPLPETSPLWDMPNVIMSAHGAGYSDMTAIRKMQVMVDNVNALCQGKPLVNVLNNAAQYK